MNKVDLSTFNNKWYKPASKTKQIIWYVLNAIVFKSSFFPFYIVKSFLLKLFGASIGTNVLIKPNVNIKYPWLLTIGNNVWIGENVWIDNLAQVTIGNNVCISQGALLLCGNHDYTKTSFDLLVKPIVIEEGVWICAKATISQGVTCKSHSVIGLAAVLQSNSEPYTIYAGNPAILIKERKLI